MTQISKDEVVRLANLASISLSDDQIKRFQDELGGILEYVDLLGQCDTDDIPPTYQVTDLEHVARPDEVIDYGIGREELLAVAPDQENNQIKVPKVL